MFIRVTHKIWFPGYILNVFSAGLGGGYGSRFPNPFYADFYDVLT